MSMAIAFKDITFNAINSSPKKNLNEGHNLICPSAPRKRNNPRSLHEVRLENSKKIKLCAATVFTSATPQTSCLFIHDCWRNIFTVMSPESLQNLESTAHYFYDQHPLLQLLKAVPLDKLALTDDKLIRLIKAKGKEIINFRSDNITDRLFIELLRHCPNVQTIECNCNNVKRALFNTCLISDFFPNKLTTLKLVNSDKGYENFVNTIQKLTALKDLHIENPTHGDKGLKLLDQFSKLPNLTTLTLKEDGFFTAKGMKVIFNSNKLSTTRVINLSKNRITSDFLEPIINSKLPLLEELNLSHNSIDDQGCLLLVNAGNMPRLKTLNLSSNKVTCAAIVEIAKQILKISTIDLTMNLSEEETKKVDKIGLLEKGILI